MPSWARTFVAQRERERFQHDRTRFDCFGTRQHQRFHDVERKRALVEKLRKEVNHASEQA